MLPKRKYLINVCVQGTHPRPRCTHCWGWMARTPPVPSLGPSTSHTRPRARSAAAAGPGSHASPGHISYPPFDFHLTNICRCMTPAMARLTFQVCPQDEREEDGDSVFYNTIIGLDGDSQVRDPFTCVLRTLHLLINRRRSPARRPGSMSSMRRRHTWWAHWTSGTLDRQKINIKI